MKELDDVKKKMEPPVIRFIGYCARTVVGNRRKK
jgi:hypothetical protein